MARSEVCFNVSDVRYTSPEHRAWCRALHQKNSHIKKHVIAINGWIIFSDRQCSAFCWQAVNLYGPFWIEALPNGAACNEMNNNVHGCLEMTEAKVMTLTTRRRRRISRERNCEKKWGVSIRKTQKNDNEWNMICTGVDLSNIGLLEGQTKIFGRTKGGNNWWKRRRFSFTGGTSPGCPKSLRL